MTTTTGTPSRRPLPTQANQAFETGTVVPPASRKAVPRATPYMPRVPMKGGTLSLEIRRPLIEPGTRATAMPTTAPTSIAGKGGM